MANLGNLIVRGVTRILGDAYANKFIGNLQGNADTATSAIKASTADSATSATSANKASIATAVQDYGTSDYREIKIGYLGSGLSSSDITHAVGFTDSGTKIKDISKDEFRNWLATASGTWPITVSNSSNSANAEYANYLNVTNSNEFRFGNISSDQMNLWFNYANPDGTQNNVSRYYFGDGKNGTNSTIYAAQFTGNAATATNADTLDGVHYQNILERSYSGYSLSGTATGWFRIAETLVHDSGGTTFLLAIQRGYSYANNESYLFSISISYNGGISITQLSGYANTRLITKIRVDWSPSQIAYVDLYINTSYTNNDYYWYTVGCTKSYTAWTANPTLVGNAYEFTTVQGCKSDRGFTGDIVGNASSASKWATPRTITLTGSVTGSVSIDGSQNVSLDTTTNHTHTFDSLNSKPNTIIGYGIVDSIRLVNDSSDLYVGARSNYGENMTGSKYLEWWNSAGWVHHKAGKFSVPGGTSSQFLKADGSLDSTAYLTEQNLQGYATTAWVNDNFYTYSESDNRYIQSETDPVWTAAKGNYYTKTECDNRFQPKGTYLTEQNLQGYATQEWVRGEEYLYRSGGTMNARAEIGITTKLFIGNSTSPDTCYTKFNCVLHGGGDESNPNWVIRDNGYAEFKSSVSANAFYASSDIRLKNILDDINIDFDKLKLIPKKYYTWKGSDILQLGTIAQDIQKIYPEVVSKNENGYLSVDYSKLSIIALAAIDKLNERIKELECQIKL